MSSFFKKHGYSQHLGSNGKFFVVDSDHPDVQFKLKFARCVPEYVTQITSKQMEELRQVDPIKAEDKARKLLADHIVCGWKGLKWEGDKAGEEVDLEYNKENALKVLKRLDQISVEIIRISSDPQNFVDLALEPKKKSS